MQVTKTSFGIYLPEHHLYFDPQGAVDVAICSHAHADHISPGVKTLYAHPITIQLIQLRFGERYAKTFVPVEYDQWIEIGVLKARLIPAGHILGSAMIEVSDGNSKLLYSGDFKLKTDITAPIGAIPKVDILITETTFANHQENHPLAKDQILKLKNYPLPIYLGVYALGKAQRINYLINQHLPDKKVYIHTSMKAIHEFYQHSGIPLSYELYRREVLKENDVIILYPPLAFRSLRYEPFYLRSFVSGFAKRNLGDIPNVLVSDHADGAEIESLIVQSQARTVYLTHGSGTEGITLTKYPQIKWQIL